MLLQWLNKNFPNEYGVQKRIWEKRSGCGKRRSVDGREEGDTRLVERVNEEGGIGSTQSPSTRTLKYKHVQYSGCLRLWNYWSRNKKSDSVANWGGLDRRNKCPQHLGRSSKYSLLVLPWNKDHHTEWHVVKECTNQKRALGSCSCLSRMTITT
jgi:hypothetical protein